MASLLEIEAAVSSNSGETLKQLCLTGNGIACLSDYMVDKEIASGEFVELLADKRLPVEMPFSGRLLQRPGGQHSHQGIY
ncbi:LysR substrate binding domain [Serratia liquefaciens]|nr:LysR substrate binding domain [Serratia liquefaciens]